MPMYRDFCFYCIFTDLHLTWSMFSKQSGSVVLVSDINLGNSKLSFLHCFCSCLSFFSFWFSHYAYVTHFEVVPQFLNVLSSFYFYFYFCFGNSYCYILKLTDSFLSQVPSNREPIMKAFFIFVSVFDL